MSFNISVKFHKNNLDYDFTHICFLAVFMYFNLVYVR